VPRIQISFKKCPGYRSPLRSAQDTDLLQEVPRIQISFKKCPGYRSPLKSAQDTNLRDPQLLCSLDPEEKLSASLDFNYKIF